MLTRHFEPWGLKGLNPMIEMQKIREQIRDAVSHLHGIDDRLAELSASLTLPSDADLMWDSQIPANFQTNLYAALDAVRTDCLQDAAETLLHAVRQSDTSLRRDWLRGWKETS